MSTLRQIKEELPLINRIHIKQPGLRRILRVNDKVIPADVAGTFEYVKKNTVIAREGRKCVDGRYSSKTARGMIARAGGDCGYVMALMAINKKKKLGLTPEQCFNEVYRVIQQKMHGPFCIHTDHHVDPSTEGGNDHLHKTVIGCGHLSKASSQKLRESYDVANSDVKKIIAYVRNLAEINKNIDMVNLDGDHNEQGVLLIESEDYTVNASDENRMYFIYDKTRDDDFMRKLVKVLDLPGVTFEDMKEESDKQLEATLHLLAKGLPLYHVTYTYKTPNVSYISTIL
jgi:hypothetical protein